MSHRNETKFALAFTFRLSVDVRSDAKIVLAEDLIQANEILAGHGVDMIQCQLDNVTPVRDRLYSILLLSQDKDLSFLLTEEDKNLLVCVVNPEFINDSFSVMGGEKNEPGVNPFHVDLESMGTPLDKNGTYMLMSAGLNSEGYRPHPRHRIYLINTVTGNRIDIFLGKNF